MAATTIKPYPHVQINVKDNSIATINFVETLPVHRPLYVMRTKKGPLGEPTWCNTYSEAAALFGAETFDPANKEYFSLPALYLRDTFTRNGAFITRYLPTQYDPTTKKSLELNPVYANSVLYARVTKSDIKQYVKDADGYTKEVWSETYQEFVKQFKYSEDDTGSDLPEGYDPATDTRTPYTKPGVQIEFYTKKVSSAEFEEIIDNPKKISGGEDSYLVPLAAFKAKDPGKYGNDLAYKLFYTPKSNVAGDVEAYGTVFYNIGFAEREDATSTWHAVTDIYTRENCAFSANPNAVNPDTGASMSIDYVLDKGFSDKAHQLPVDFALFEDNINLIGLVIASFEADEEDKFGGLKTPGAINAGDVLLGALTEDEKKMVQAYFFEEADPYGATPDKEKLFDELSKYKHTEFGYKLNVISGKNLINEPYDCVVVIKDAEKKALYDRNGKVYGFEYTNVDTDDNVEIDAYSTTELEIVDPDADPYIYKSTGVVLRKDPWYTINAGVGNIFSMVSLTDFFNIALKGGTDGTYYEPVRTGNGMISSQILVDEEGNKVIDVTNKIQSSDDLAMYDFVKLRLPVIKDRIVESLRFPFTHIFDVGYSMKTKKAICDFLDVRDDFVFIASPQILYSDGTGRSITQNDMAKDEAYTEALRSYALLMRESVLYGTDCMRVSIYEHSGHLVDSVYQGVVPHTYWAAVQYSQYGNLTYMSSTEPRGLPYSYNLLFKDQNWTNYRADSQSRVWDEGGNYVQFADMTRLFYPALRTVYRAATSVLIDEWVVAAVVYTKYVARRAWANFSGRNDYASILQDAIKKYIDTELHQLFNGKYSFNVTVYQTAEEQELGYIQHVKISITFGATMRVLDVDIEVNREGFVPEE